MSKTSAELHEADVVLRDGSTVHLRPVGPGDEPRLRRLFNDLKPASQAFRFFSGAVDLDSAAQAMAAGDGERYGLLATRGTDGRPVGHGIYASIGDGIAEVAFAVLDELQGRGLGTILLAHLAEAAADQAVATFVAEMLPENLRMIEMLRESGFPVAIESGAEGIRVEFPTSLSAEVLDRFEQRDRVSARAAVETFLKPSSIAVIGASRRRGTVGGEVLHNLVESGFPGPLFPVNPAASEVQSLPAFESVAKLPESPGLAVLALPADAVLECARECAARDVRALVVLSAGFAEIGEQGAVRQRELLAICRRAGMRLIGPNCLGVLNTAPGLEMNATFAPAPPVRGNVGFVTQSGALGLSLLELALARGLGVSSFASVGNRADITGNDLLDYWETDEATEVALLYIESFSDPRRFARVAKRIGRHKPVVAVKSGRSASGVRAAGSHTGALLAASDRTVDALFEQTGVIRAESLGEMLDVASLLSSQPLPRGPRVGIVTNAGGPGIMCADACEAAGLEVPALSDSLRADLSRALRPEASLGNPVDLIATASAEEFRGAIEALGASEEIDALIVIFIRPLKTRGEDVAAAVHEALRAIPRGLPTQTVFMSPADRQALEGSMRIPMTAYPEDAARALGKARRHARWRARPAEAPAEFPDSRPEEAAATIAEALAAEKSWLDAEDCARLLECYGILMPEARIAEDPQTAGELAAELGGRVALKAHGGEILHKTELGAVQAGLEGEHDVRAAAAAIDERLAERGIGRESFLVQRMVEGGVELLVGVATDPVFGPVIACGAGGTAVELLGDVSVRVCPLSPSDAQEMVHSLAIFPMLMGFRGMEPVDLDAINDLLLRVGSLADRHREIAELDLNPVIATPRCALAVDARIRVEPFAGARSWPSTWA